MPWLGDHLTVSNSDSLFLKVGLISLLGKEDAWCVDVIVKGQWHGQVNGHLEILVWASISTVIQALVAWAL